LKLQQTHSISTSEIGSTGNGGQISTYGFDVIGDNVFTNPMPIAAFTILNKTQTDILG
jgi:hypothetical protein